MDKGIYCLVFSNPACTVRVGALGEIPFRAGWHAYIGSALGSGGLRRLFRHVSLAENRSHPQKWHVDYLTVNPHFLLSYAVFAPTGDRLECPLAARISGEGIAGFGCSDCTCHSHLVFCDHDPEAKVVAAFRSLGLSPVITTIKSR